MSNDHVSASSGGDGFGRWIDGQLTAIHEADQWRSLRPFDACGPTGQVGGRTVTSFASNDYLGLSHHPAVLRSARSALDRWGSGATASRHVVGTRPIHTELEESLAAWKNTDHAVVFSSGFAANVGLLSTFGGPDCLIVSDELNHASIIDGCRLSRSPVAVARHNDVDHIADLLDRRQQPRAIVVSEAVFSMDGDVAPVDELGDLCARRGALLVLDEAHSVIGPDLRSVADRHDLELLRVVTLSKALGSMGGAICGRTSLIDLLINRCRPLIFSTALSPADTAAATAAIGIVRSDEGTELIDRLTALVHQIRPGHDSPIVPVMVGDEAAALRAADALLEQGVLIPAIRPPTVAPGTARLRIAVSTDHTTDDIATLKAVIGQLGLEL